MAAINIPYVKSQVRKVIQAAPTEVHNWRQKYVSDGARGRKKEGDPYLVGEGFVALFDNASSPKVQVIVSQGGKQEQESNLRLLVEYEPSIDIEIDDVWTHRGVTYRFANVTNILELDIMYEIDLEVKED